VDVRASLSGDPVDVAPLLLGWRLESGFGDQLVAVRITEVEAYRGTGDSASHAFRGPTPRNAVMFGPAGFLYVYFIYGMHWCANVVCEDDGVAGAVLIRAGEVVDGVEVARSRRPAARNPIDLARGPAKLAGCLGLTGALNGTDLCDDASVVRLVPTTADTDRTVVQGPRVGVGSAADLPWRFSLGGDLTVSAFRAGIRRGSRMGQFVLGGSTETGERE
jgi:DNA-3-methyladenine glycosylase